MRLLTVSVRPGRPNTAASSYLSGIIREPLNGQRADCPVDPDVPAAICSPDRATRGLLRAATAGPDEWGAPIAVNLPAITVTAGQMVSALAQVAGEDVAALVDWHLDQMIASIIQGWPSRLRTDRATSLGLQPDENLEAIVRAHIGEWAAILRDLAIGLLIAGCADVWNPDAFWGHPFVTDHPLLAKIWEPLIEPHVAVASFVCSIGNVHSPRCCGTAGAFLSSGRWPERSLGDRPAR